MQNLKLPNHAGRIGYLPGSSETTTVGMVDIDLKQFDTLAFESVVGQVTSAMDRHNVKWYRENSTNGGVHLWVFLSEGLGYGQTRDFLKAITSEAGQPKLETYPAGEVATSKWVFMPYAGAAIHPDNLGLTFLIDRQGQPIPLWALPERIERTPIRMVLDVLSRQGAATKEAAQQSQARELAPEGFIALKTAVLQPPNGLSRHESIEAFLNLGEQMGKQSEMAELLKSEAVYSIWVADNKRTHEAWSAEVDRWVEGSHGGHQYGIKFLLDQGFDIPDLPRIGGPENPQYRGKLSWQQSFDALQLKYAPQSLGEKRGRVRFFSTREMRNIPRPEPLVEGVLVRRSLCALVGESGAGKSMAALDIALHVALGREWYGRKVVQGNVVFLAAEAEAETSHRFFGWCDYHKVNPDTVPLNLGAISLGFTDVEDGGGFDELIGQMKDLEQATGRIELVVVDTVARTFGDGDENSNSDMIRYSNCSELLTRIFGCTVWLVHHTGKDSTKGGRGASSFKAPLEMECTLTQRKANPKTNQKSHIAFEQTKNRGGAGEESPVKLIFTTHSWKEEGQDLNTGILVQMSGDVAVTFGPGLLTDQQQQVLTALLELYSENESPINRKDWHERCGGLDIGKRRVNEHINYLLMNSLVREVIAGKTYLPSE